MIRFSIVTTSLNHARFLEETLESVQTQSYPAAEHLVVDGCSTDGTLALLEAKRGDAWVHLRWSSETDGGQTQAMNKGLRQATGDVIGWLNSDDRYRPGCLATVARIFEADPTLDVLYGDYTFIDQNGAHLRDRREIGFHPLLVYYHRESYIPTTAAFFRRRIFDDGHWLNESLQHGMDYDFVVRLARNGYRFGHVRSLLADFRLHPDSKTCTLAELQRKEWSWTRQHHSPLAQRMPAGVLRNACFGGLAMLAASARYATKLVSGCYLPDSLSRRWLHDS